MFTEGKKWRVSKLLCVVKIILSVVFFFNVSFK